MPRTLIWSCCVAVASLAPGAWAGTVTFLGEDLGSGDFLAPRLTSTPNADAAAAAFQSQLVGVGVETFESFADDTPAPLAVSFPGSAGNITATLTGAGRVNTLTTGTLAGRYPISGDNYWETGDSFAVTFDKPVAAFGFWATDIGDFGGQVVLTLTNGGTETINIGNTTGSSGTIGGGVLFFGLLKTAGETFTSVTFGTTAGGFDFFGFDDFTVGDVGQLVGGGSSVIPLAPSALLAGAGLVGLTALRRRATAD